MQNLVDLWVHFGRNIRYIFIISTINKSRATCNIYATVLACDKGKRNLSKEKAFDSTEY